MKFSISLDQRNYLHTEGYIPFYELLSVSELDFLNKGINQSLKESKCGRDLWRINDDVKKIVFSRRLANLVFELVQKKPIRLAFDQVLNEQILIPHKKVEKWSCSSYFEKEPIFCINSLLGFFLICLDEETKGSGYFILPGRVFPYEKLLTPKQKFLLIGYGDMHAQYLYEIQDPEVHFLKSIGYVFGDKLSEQLHPVLLR